LNSPLKPKTQRITNFLGYGLFGVFILIVALKVLEILGGKSNMKGLGVFLIFLLLASVLMPVLSVTAQPAKVPHEDPEAVGSALDSFSFLSQYAEIFALVALGNILMRLS
jgi:hypothetical protein